MTRRHICVVLVNRANYARVQTVLEALRADINVKLTLVVSSSALLGRFGRVVDVIRSDGFEVDEMVWSSIEGDTPETMARSVGLSILDLTSIFSRIKPDLVLTVADRYETIATAIAARFMNIPVAHTQGGEVSGSIDESVRHSVSKLANMHFPATAESAQNLVKMGELPDTIYMLGCPSIDLAARTNLALPGRFFQHAGGVGAEIKQNKPYVVVSQHPVTTEFEYAKMQIEETLQAMKTIAQEGVQIVWLWPNIDAGSDVFSKEIRSFREWDDPSDFRFYKNFEPEDYIKLIANSSCLIGNSSSGLRESAFLGIPVVNVGTRQNLRERGENVLDVGHSREKIAYAVRQQISKGRFPTSDLFGRGDSGPEIARILATAPLAVEKVISYVQPSKVPLD